MNYRKESVIAVQGTAALRVQPDIFWLELSLSDNFTRTDKAYEYTNTVSGLMVFLAKEIGLSTECARSMSLRIQRGTEEERDSWGRRKDALVCRQTLRAYLPLDRRLVDNFMDLVDKRLPDVDINSGFCIRADHPARKEALEAAFREAKRNAETLACVSGCKVGRVLSLEEIPHEDSGEAKSSIFYPEYENGKHSGAANGIAPEFIVVSETVRAVFEFGTNKGPTA